MAKWRGGGGLEKVHEPGLELGTPEAQRCYVSARCREAVGADIFKVYVFIKYLYFVYFSFI